MKKDDRYSYGLDLLRILCTIAVLVYHVFPDIIPGGYLAVCSFLVLHGYLYVVSFMRNNSDSSIIQRYIKRLFRLYIPMAITVALSIYVLRFFPDIIWLNEKPETLSVLTASNNWWQINAGLSYFTRLTDSPFTHFWYISLLLQEEIFLPIICYIYAQLRKRFGFFIVFVPFLIQVLATAMILPQYFAKGYPLMRIYYGTDARVFSTLLGMALGFLHQEKRFTLSIFKKGFLSILMFVSLLGALTYSFFVLSPDSESFQYSFLGASLLTLPIISLSTNEELPLFSQIKNPVSRFLSSFSYEVYLIHYPLLFFALSSFELKGKIIFYFFITVIVSAAILHFALSIRFKKELKTILLSCVKIIVLLPILYYAFLGTQDIYLAKDNSQEMAELEAQLIEDAKYLEEQQKLYEERQKQNAEQYNDPLAFAEEVNASDLRITGIGDSVMLGAVRVLYETFPNGDFDAQQNRSHYPVMTILRERAGSGTLGNPVIIGIGTNNVLPIEDLRTIVGLCGEREVFWLTTTNDWQFKNNDTIHSLGDEFDNVTIVDWELASKDHSEYFFSDGIHLTTEGRKAYVELIKESIERVYGEKIAAKHKAEQKEKRILGIGSSWLMATASTLQNNLDDCVILAEEHPDTDTVLKQIKLLEDCELLPSKCFFVVGTNESDYELVSKILPELEESKIILITLPPSPENNTFFDTNKIKSSFPNIMVLKWDIDYHRNKDYYLADRIHLSPKGIEELTSFIMSSLNNFD